MIMPQKLMELDDKWYRYDLMRREAGSELMNFIHGLCTDDDVFDRFELAFLWRQVCEGMQVSDETWQRMVTETNA